MIAWFARNGVAANLLMFAVMGFGAWTLISERIPTEVFPDTPSRYISISVPYPGATPEEVEETIVLRIEDAIQQVAGIKRIVSTASSSGGNVTLEIDDADLARQIRKQDILIEGAVHSLRQTAINLEETELAQSREINILRKTLEPMVKEFEEAQTKKQKKAANGR